MVYAIGSLLFALALVAATGVIIASFMRHGAQMVAALRTLSLESAYAPAKAAPSPSAALRAPAGEVTPLPLPRPVRPLAVPA